MLSVPPPRIPAKAGIPLVPPDLGASDGRWTPAFAGVQKSAQGCESCIPFEAGIQLLSEDPDASVGRWALASAGALKCAAAFGPRSKFRFPFFQKRGHTLPEIFAFKSRIKQRPARCIVIRLTIQNAPDDLFAHFLAV